jgi:hypothetical protein
VPNVLEIRDGWKLFIVAGGVMVSDFYNIGHLSQQGHD